MGVVPAGTEMTLLIVIVGTATSGFYLYFLWEMSNELKHLRRKRLTRRTWQPLHRNLFRVDPADLWAEKSDRHSSRIKDIS